MPIKHVYRKMVRSVEEVAKLRADRERYQREKPSPEQLPSEGGHERFVPLGELIQVHQLAVWLKESNRDSGQTHCRRIIPPTGEQP